MRSAFTKYLLLLVLLCTTTGCDRDHDDGIYAVQYYIPPRTVITSDPDDPFAKGADLKTLEEITDELGIVFDAPGSKLITMRLSFPGFVLCHNREAHLTISRYLDKHHKGWRIRTADETSTKP